MFLNPLYFSSIFFSASGLYRPRLAEGAAPLALADRAAFLLGTRMSANSQKRTFAMPAEEAVYRIRSGHQPDAFEDALE